MGQREGGSDTITTDELWRLATAGFLRRPPAAARRRTHALSPDRHKKHALRGLSVPGAAGHRGLSAADACLHAPRHTAHRPPPGNDGYNWVRAVIRTTQKPQNGNTYHGKKLL